MRFFLSLLITVVPVNFLRVTPRLRVQFRLKQPMPDKGLLRAGQFIANRLDTRGQLTRAKRDKFHTIVSNIYIRIFTDLQKRIDAFF